jgi:hypothetical protein
MNDEQALLPRIERYLRETGIAASLFGQAASADPRLVFDLRRGRQPGRNLSARIEALLSTLLTPVQARKLVRNKR